MKIPLGPIISIEPVLQRRHISGVGAEAKFNDHQVAWKITLGRYISVTLPCEYNSDDQVVPLPEVTAATLILHGRNNPNVPSPETPRPPQMGTGGTESALDPTHRDSRPANVQRAVDLQERDG